MARLPGATGWFVILLMLLVIPSEICVVKALGVNWGTQAFNPLPPGDVVKLMQLNGIKKVKIFDADYDVIRSLAGSGIEVMIAAPNDLLAKLAADSNAATAWVKQNVTQFLFKGGVDIKWVAVGNEPFLTAYNNSFLNTTYPALLNVQTALEKAGHSEIRTIIPFNADVLTDGTPSQTRFKPEYLDQINPMLTIFNRTGAPFSVNLYPYISLYQNPNYPIDYAFFSGTTSPLADGNIVYQNALDASLDGLISALTAAGYPNMPVMLGEIGWPTDGAPFATLFDAWRKAFAQIIFLCSSCFDFASSGVGGCRTQPWIQMQTWKIMDLNIPMRSGKSKMSIFNISIIIQKDWWKLILR